MILLSAIVVGLGAAWLRSLWSRSALKLPALRGEWLILVAVVPQLIVFFLPGVQRLASREVAAAVLTISQALLLLFVWWNRDRPGFWLLGLGLLLNFAVIALNGGLMPISPETVTRLAPDGFVETLEMGRRLGGSKDVLIPTAETRLAFLSDRLTFPASVPLRIAFSVGDVLIAAGVFWFFWRSADPADGAPQ